MSGTRSTIRPGAQHLERFRSVVVNLNDDRWKGHSPSAFAERLQLPAVRLPEAGQTRSELRAYLAEHTPTIQEASIAVLAWGGMRADHARLLFSRSDRQWLRLVETISRSELTRQESFFRFRELRLANSLPGMGPAYFTKLIHFLDPGTAVPPGHILDQWAAMSVNLIWRAPVTRLNLHRRWVGKQDNWSRQWSADVSEGTAADQYETFCQHVDWLAENLGVAAETIDQAFLSKDGAVNWRAYLLSNCHDDL